MNSKKTVKVTVTELIPTSSRKSFYRKALVLEGGDGTKWLRSYDTIICSVGPDGVVHKHWDGSTATTNAHIRSFLETYAPRTSSADFRKISAVEEPPVLISQLS